MTDKAHQSTSLRRPSAWYLFHLAIAALGITWLTMALGGELRIRAGLDAFGTLRQEGPVAFIFSLSIGYMFRLIFWDKAPDRYRGPIRNCLGLIFFVEPILAIVAVLARFTQGNVQVVGGDSGTAVVTIFTVFGVLCQISTVIWLLRYRRE